MLPLAHSEVSSIILLPAVCVLLFCVLFYVAFVMYILPAEFTGQDWSLNKYPKSNLDCSECCYTAVSP